MIFGSTSLHPKKFWQFIDKKLKLLFDNHLFEILVFLIKVFGYLLKVLLDSYSLKYLYRYLQ